MNSSPLSPAIYIGHGAPLNVLWKNVYNDNLKKFGKKNDIPSTIVVVSAHWEKEIPLQITSSENPGIIYDYYGFPQEMYELEYPASGNPQLADEIAQVLNGNGWQTKLNPLQGLDHGTWIPLKIMYPSAEIPIVQLSIPIPRSPIDLYKIGSLLSPLRDQGVMFLGSGNLIHNLAYVFQQIRAGKTKFTHTEPVDQWAKKTDEWIKEKLDTSQFDELLSAPETAPNFKLAAPTTEHFDPLYFILGTLRENEGINHFHEGFEAGSISMRCFSSES